MGSIAPQKRRAKYLNHLLAPSYYEQNTKYDPVITFGGDTADTLKTLEPSASFPDSQNLNQRGSAACS